MFCKCCNISFRYPRTDTCSACDKLSTKVKSLELELAVATNENKDKITITINQLRFENEVHKRKRDEYYTIRRQTKKKTGKMLHERLSVWTMIQVPNIPTNGIYYKRQHSVYAFNIHVPSDGSSIFYMYTQTERNKSSDEVLVCTLVHHFVFDYLNGNVNHLDIFTDSRASRQTNFTCIRFLYNLVNEQKKLKPKKITFPIRGDSYVKNDNNKGLINSKSRAETSNDWVNIVRESR